MYIAIGGIDGAGKSTLQRLLLDRLRSGGREVIGLAEPYHPFVKELLEASQDPWTDVLLFALDRWLLRPKIFEWISKRYWLVSSRSLYCSVAYQGAQGIEWDDILRANNWRSLVLPDIFFVLDIDPEVAYSRCSKREKFERRDFLALVREQYLKLLGRSNLFPTRMVLLDASAPKGEVLEQALRYLGEMPGPEG